MTDDVITPLRPSSTFRVDLLHEQGCPAPEGECICSPRQIRTCATCGKWVPRAASCTRCDTAQRVRDQAVGAAMREAGYDFRAAVMSRLCQVSGRHHQLEQAFERLTVLVGALKQRKPDALVDLITFCMFHLPRTRTGPADESAAADMVAGTELPEVLEALQALDDAPSRFRQLAARFDECDREARESGATPGAGAQADLRRWADALDRLNASFMRVAALTEPTKLPPT